MVFTINFPGTLHFTLPYLSNTSNHIRHHVQNKYNSIISNFFAMAMNTNENRLGYGLGLEVFCKNKYMIDGVYVL